METVRRYIASHMTNQAAFAKQNNISRTALRCWLEKYRGKELPELSDSEFIKLKPTQQPRCEKSSEVKQISNSIKISLGDITISVPECMPPSYVASLARMLSGRSL